MLYDCTGNEDDPAVIRDMLLANPEQLALLKHNNPKLSEALTSGDLGKYSFFFLFLKIAITYFIFI